MGGTSCRPNYTGTRATDPVLKRDHQWMTISRTEPILTAAIII